MRDLLTDAADLVLGRACLHCDRPGRVLCPTCLAAVRGHPVRHVPLAGLEVARAALEYHEGGQELVLAYKEHGVRALAPMLALLLADAVDSVLKANALTAAVLVPVPAHRRPERGFDALAGIVRPAVASLGCRGLIVHRSSAVRMRRGGRPMKSLSAIERRDAAASLFHARRSLPDGHPVVIVDDVITTGSTVRAMAGVLTEAGALVIGAAAVTAVVRAEDATTQRGLG